MLPGDIYELAVSKQGDDTLNTDSKSVLQVDTVGRRNACEQRPLLKMIVLETILMIPNLQREGAPRSSESANLLIGA